MKKFIAFIFIIMTMSLTTSVFATENQEISDKVENIEVQNEDNVKLVYDAYKEVKAALDSLSYDELASKVEDFYEVIDIYNEFTEEELESLAVLLGAEDAEEAFAIILNDWINANVVVSMNEVYEAYLADKTPYTALDFVELYDGVYNDPEYVDEELRELVRGFFENIHEDYEEALEIKPSDDIMAVYNAYMDLESYLQFGYVEDLAVAVENFYEVVDIYNEFTEGELDILATLIGLENGEEAYSVILSDWINANVIMEMNNVYEAYLNDPTLDTAKEFVEYYDAIYNDPDYVDEELREMVYNFFFTIDEDYEDAKKLIDESQQETEDPKEEPKQEEKNEDENIVNPETGDIFWSTIFNVTICACAIGYIVNKKVVKEN